MVHGGGSRRGGGGSRSREVGGGGGGRSRGGGAVVADHEERGSRRGGGAASGGGGGRYSGATVSSSTNTGTGGIGGRRQGGARITSSGNRHIMISTTTSTTTTTSARHGGGSRTIHTSHPRHTTATTSSTTTRHPGEFISDRSDNSRRAGEAVRPSSSSTFGFPSFGRSANSWIPNSFGSGRNRGTGSRRSHGSSVSIVTTSPSYSYGRRTGGRRAAGDYVRDDNDMEEPLLIRPRNYEDEDDDSQEDCSCCTDCCDGGGFICLCCTCIASMIAACCFGRRSGRVSTPTTAATTSIPTPARRNNGNGNFTTRIMIPLSVGTLILFGILMVMSSSSSTSNENATWILNAGESRRIQPNWLTKSIQVQATTTQQQKPNQSTSAEVSVDLYDIPSYNCPPLNGPMVTKQYTTEMILNSGDYQYDYYYLNKGSRMEIDIQFVDDDDPRAGLGQSDIYILQGEDKIDTLHQHENDHNSVDSDPFWLDDLLDTAKKSWRNIQTESFWGRFYGTNRNDIYTVLYDNPYTTHTAHLIVDLWLYLTTYNLQGYSPTCTMTTTTSSRRGSTTCPSISHRYFSQCLLVDTTATSSGPEEENQEIHIEIIQYRDYYLICFLSLIPAMLVMGWQIWNCCCKQAVWQRLLSQRSAATEQHPEEEDEEDGGNNNSHNDPPFAPHTTTAAASTSAAATQPQPSAPPSSQDTTSALPVANAEVIASSSSAAAVVATNVEPVPPPTDATTK